jgi:hypothetical protein
VNILEYNRNISRHAFKDAVSDNNIDYSSPKIELNDHNAKTFFAESASTGLIKFSDGKVLIRSLGLLDRIGYAFIIIGMVTSVCILKNNHIDIESSLPTLIIVIVIFVLGLLIVSVVKTYSVIDYKSKTIYTETQLKEYSIWKSGKTPIYSIIEISIDNRPTEASAQNIGKGYLINSKANVQGQISKCESAVAALLKSGKIFYITEFSNDACIREAYKSFSAEIAKSFNINYKSNYDDYRLVVKKRGPKYYFDLENYTKVTSDSVLMSIARIVFGVIFFLGAVYLLFYLIHNA